MYRITKSIFKDVQIYMLLLGLSVGLLFPFFLVFVMHFPKSDIFRIEVFAATFLAGLALGFLNYTLTKFVIAKRFEIFNSSLSSIASKLGDTHNSQICIDSSNCTISVDSEDSIGNASKSVNLLIDALSQRTYIEFEIRKFVESINKCIELKELSLNILKQSLDLFSAEAGMILEFEGDLWLETASIGVEYKDFEKDFLSDPGGLIKKMQQTKETIHISISKDVPVTISAFSLSFKPKELMIFPIKNYNKVIGVMFLLSNVKTTTIACDVYKLVESYISNAFQNAMLHDKLQVISVMDELTGLYNRRFGMKRLVEEFARSSRGKSTLSLIMIDIDHFKNVNDTYGHQAGDMVLQKVSGVLKSSVRLEDVALRYGGEEFLMVLPSTDVEGAVVLGERLRKLIKELEITWGKSKIKITSSFGVSEYNNDVKNEQILLSQADSALYSAKNSGRDKVTVFKD
jgi:diguanylate cyclase (GGDEF)-like protein